LIFSIWEKVSGVIMMGRGMADAGSGIADAGSGMADGEKRDGGWLAGWKSVHRVMRGAGAQE
jgi:hypothetical protein